MSYFDIQISIATFKIKKRPFTFSKPAPEASPVLTLGISSKGQVRTRGGGGRKKVRVYPTFTWEKLIIRGWSTFFTKFPSSKSASKRYLSA